MRLEEQLSYSINQPSSALPRLTRHFPPKRHSSQLYTLDLFHLNLLLNLFFICFVFFFFLLLIWQKTFLLQQLGESIVLYSRFMESTRCYNAVNVFENCQWIWSNLQSQCYNYKKGLMSMCSTNKSKIPTFFLVPTRCPWSLFKSVFTTQISISTVSDFKKISSFSLNKDILSSLSKSSCSLQSNGFNSVSETDFSSSERYVDNQNRTFQNKGHVTKN